MHHFSFLFSFWSILVLSWTTRTEQRAGLAWCRSSHTLENVGSSKFLKIAMAGDFLRSHRGGDSFAGGGSRSYCESKIWLHCSRSCYPRWFQPGIDNITIGDLQQEYQTSQTNCIHRIIIIQNYLLAHIFTRSAKCCDYWLPILLVRITIALLWEPFQVNFPNYCPIQKLINSLEMYFSNTWTQNPDANAPRLFPPDFFPF